MKILIVEDEPITAVVLAAELKKAGHRIVGPAAAARDALLLAEQEKPDVAVLEIELDGLYAGIELARDLNQLEVPCVFATAQSTLAHTNSAWAIAYLAKPYNPDDIAEMFDVIEGVVAGTLPRKMKTLPALELFGV